MSRAPNYEFQEWWNKQREKENLDLFEDKSDQSSSPFITVDVVGNNNGSGSSKNRSDPSVKKERARSARQLSWVCLLKFQQIAATVGFISNGLLHVVKTANRRILSRDSPIDSSSSRLYRAIRVFLIVVIGLLGFELVAYFKGWHFRPPSVGSADVLGLVAGFYARWIDIRANYLAPPLQSLTNMCIVLFIVQSVDRIVLILGCFWIKFRRIRPIASVDYDGNVASVDYPMVLVQIPMCNEREVRTCRFLSPFKIYFCSFDFSVIYALGS
jgi:hypothetical protein